MSHYLDDPELTAQTIVEGWLLTGDQGRFEGSTGICSSSDARKT